MGLSASQARYLQLTARRSDNEREAQQINHARTENAKRMQDISLKYTEGKNNRQLNFISYSTDGSDTKTSVPLTYETITAEFPAGLGYQLVDANGTPVRPCDKDAKALLEQANKDYYNTLQQRVYSVETVGEDGSKTQTNIDGSNFFELIKNDTVFNAKGEAVDNTKFSNNIKNMNAVEFNKYWKTYGYTLGSEAKFEEKEIPGNKEAAEKALEEAKVEAAKLANTSCIYDDRCMDTDYLEEQLRNGVWFLQKEDPTVCDEFGKPKMVKVDYASELLIEDVLDESDDADITAEYNTKMNFYQRQDKQLELALQQIQTTHNAIQTEIDSVKKVIDKNVEKSFKTFG